MLPVGLEWSGLSKAPACWAHHSEQEEKGRPCVPGLGIAAGLSWPLAAFLPEPRSHSAWASSAVLGSTRWERCGQQRLQWLGAWQRENRADNSARFFSLFPEPVEAAGRETALEAWSPSWVMVDNKKRAAQVQGRCL